MTIMITGSFLDKKTDQTQFAMNGVAQDIDGLNHEVNGWADLLLFLIQDLEMFAMANDSHHPKEYEHMLSQVKGRIESRLKDGSW